MVVFIRLNRSGREGAEAIAKVHDAGKDGR